jgi:hypothetical protein
MAERRNSISSSAPLAVCFEVAAVIAVWLVFAWSLTAGRPAFAYDSLRDVAYAIGISRGEWLLDPMLAGLPAWYPPGMPAFFALVSRISGQPVAACYASASLWFAWLGPVFLYLLVRGVWNRTTAWLSLACVLLGSRWWLLHAAHPMASVQSVSVALATLLAWRHAGRSGGPWLFGTVLLAGLTIWCHILCGAMVLGTIAIHSAGMWGPGRASVDPGRRAMTKRAAWVVGGALILGAPLILQQIALPRLNDAPHHWFAPELHDPRFALHSRTPLVILFGILGLGSMWSRWESEGWVVSYFALGLLGALLGYAGHDLGWSVPWFVPHTLQWHQQLAFTIAAAVGIVRSARRAAKSQAQRRLWTVAFAVLAVGPAVPELKSANSYLTIVGPSWKSVIQTAEWLDSHADPHAVLAASPEAAYMICGLVGRRAVVLPQGHLNPAADYGKRRAATSQMLLTDRESTFVQVAREYQVDYLLSTNDVTPARVRALYAAWKSLELVRSEDSTAMLYRVRTR